MIKEAIKKIKAKTDLSKEEVFGVFAEIMSGATPKEDIKDFLKTLSEKGESADEIAAAAQVMRNKAIRIESGLKDLVDTCGTGGAPVRDVNVSTISAIVIAASDIKVAKHGNRSFTGKCGSADLLEALGVNIHIKPDKAVKLLKEANFTFIFAPDYHPAMKNVVEARRELASRSIFNILGPLSNPAGADIQVLGVYDEKLTELMANSLAKLGTKAAMVVHGLLGLDEVSIKGKTKVSEVKNGKVSTYYVTASDFGIAESPLDEIKGGDPAYNKKIALDILGGKDKGPRCDMVLINAACVFKLTGKAKDFKEGVKMAEKTIDTGAALAALEKIKELSNK